MDSPVPLDHQATLVQLEPPAAQVLKVCAYKETIQ